MKAPGQLSPIIEFRQQNKAMTVKELRVGQTNVQASPGFEQKLCDLTFVAFDTETTGLNPVACRLVELSGVKFKGTGEEISTFSALINPEISIPPQVVAIHGICDEMVAREKTMAQVVPEFFSWAAPEHTVLLAHNASFDIGFLEVALCRLSRKVPGHIVVDTLSLARRLLSGCPNYQLKTLVEHLGIAADTYHRALADSFHVRDLFLQLKEHLGAESTLADLLAVSGILKFQDPSSEDPDDTRKTRPEFVFLRQAIDSGQDVLIRYSGARKSVRTVTPRVVLYTRGNYYLSAYCHFAQAERTFRVDKIINMEMVDRQ